MNRSLLKISALIISSMALFACSEKKPPPPDPATIPVPVNLYEAHMDQPRFYSNFPGTVVAAMQVDIRSVIEGYVTGIFFKEGSLVKKGQKLYTIDDSKYRASYGQAQAAIRVAQANLDQAQKDADRYTYLNDHDAVARQTLDHAMTALQNAKSLLANAKQDLAKTQTDLDYSVIKAPFDGTIGISQVKMGNIVVPGQSILNTISTDGPVNVDFIVNEKQIPYFAKLEHDKTATKDSIFTLGLSDNSVYPYPGQISLIDRGVNPQTGSIIVRLSFPNPSSALRAGMSCTVRVRNNDTAKQLMIPGKAIVEQMGEYFVFVAKDTTIATGDTTAKNKTAQSQGPSLYAIQRKVQLGQVVADRTIIRAGIQDGDKIVVDGIQKLHDGSLITAGSPAPSQKGAAH